MTSTYYAGAALLGTLCLCSPAVADGAVARPLTAGQVSCDAAQLGRLARRIAVAQDFDHDPALFLWRSSAGGGGYAGLAVTDGIRPTPNGDIALRDERQLSIDLLVGEKSDVLSPERPLVPRGVLSRRAQDSNLVYSASAFVLTVSLEAAATGGEPPDPLAPKVPLTVNNLVAPSGSGVPASAADAVGRGLQEIAVPCHERFTSFDEKVFRVLSRTLRPSLCFTGDLPGNCPSGGGAWNIVLFRGEKPNTYKARLFSYSRNCDDEGNCSFGQARRADLEFIVNSDSAGRLTDGEMRLRPSAFFLTVFLLPPVHPGQDQQGPDVFGAAPFVNYEGSSPRTVLLTSVDWKRLLQDSAWNR